MAPGTAVMIRSIHGGPIKDVKKQFLVLMLSAWFYSIPFFLLASSLSQTLGRNVYPSLAQFLESSQTQSIPQRSISAYQCPASVCKPIGAQMSKIDKDCECSIRRALRFLRVPPERPGEGFTGKAGSGGQL